MEKSTSENKFRNKNIWKQNREQLIYIGRRNIKIDVILKRKLINEIKTMRSWVDLFSLCLSKNFNFNKFNIIFLIKFLISEEVIIVDSHLKLLKYFKIHYWDKDSISNILPAISCALYKSEPKIFMNK